MTSACRDVPAVAESTRGFDQEVIVEDVDERLEETAHPRLVDGCGHDDSIGHGQLMHGLKKFADGETRDDGVRDLSGQGTEVDQADRCRDVLVAELVDGFLSDAVGEHSGRGRVAGSGVDDDDAPGLCRGHGNVMVCGGQPRVAAHSRTG